MKTELDECFICFGRIQPSDNEHYSECQECGHNQLVATDKTGIVINETLDMRSMHKSSGLDRFKNKVLRRFMTHNNKNTLLDIGSGSGKFLAQSKNKFDRVYGIEVSQASAEFAQKELGLEIHSSIETIEDELTVATAWHSFEHIPPTALGEILSKLHRQSSDDFRFIISVPNANSWQYKLFQKQYAFYDIPNHLHQFTYRSLTKLMQNYGFLPYREVYSFPYNSFGFLQGLINKVTCSHNLLYYKLKRNQGSMSKLQFLTHIFLAMLLSPVAILLVLIEIFIPKKQGVLSICFKKQ